MTDPNSTGPNGTDPHNHSHTGHNDRYQNDRDVELSALLATRPIAEHGAEFWHKFDDQLESTNPSKRIDPARRLSFAAAMLAIVAVGGALLAIDRGSETTSPAATTEIPVVVEPTTPDSALETDETVVSEPEATTTSTTSEPDEAEASYVPERVTISDYAPGNSTNGAFTDTGHGFAYPEGQLTETQNLNGVIDVTLSAQQGPAALTARIYQADFQTAVDAASGNSGQTVQFSVPAAEEISADPKSYIVSSETLDAVSFQRVDGASQRTYIFVDQGTSIIEFQIDQPADQEEIAFQELLDQVVFSIAVG